MLQWLAILNIWVHLNQPCDVDPPVNNRDMETVLQEDREALRNLQKHQPRFTDDQKKELSQVHPWIRTGRLPRAINIPVSCAAKTPRYV